MICVPCRATLWPREYFGDKKIGCVEDTTSTMLAGAAGNALILNIRYNRALPSPRQSSTSLHVISIHIEAFKRTFQDLKHGDADT